MAIIIDGKKLAADIKADLKSVIQNNFLSRGLKPGLVTILVGLNPASQSYVKSKYKSCIELGMNSQIVELNENISQSELIETINRFNYDDNFHGILVQQPLPKHIDQKIINGTILPEKDVDGFNPVNVGNLLSGEKSLQPCTPLGIKEIFIRYNILTEGKHIVIIGRSNIVGKPFAAMMMQKQKYANATVTVCHSASKNLEEITKSADILVAAIGKPYFVNSKMIKENVIIIDVGINRVETTENEKGYKIVGDVDFNDVLPYCNMITPVPGGVGLLTVAMLMKNTIQAAKNFYKIN